MVTRFAPAPTGWLHLGHVANAIFVWGLAAIDDADVLLRVEDHDGQRCRPAFEAALLDDLDWLGFVPSRYPTAAFRQGRCDGRQSDRGHLYAQAARDLESRGLLYGCACSRARLQQQSAAGVPHTCAARGLPADDGMTWRVRLAHRQEDFMDRLAGPQAQEPASMFGDPAIRDRTGHWTYQFAVTVDDWLQDVDLVVRGMDLLPSTGLQIQLGRLIGRPLPARFAHHPLIMQSPTQKLSKSDGATGIAALRAAGWTAADVIGLAASAVGLLPAPRSVCADEAGDLVVRGADRA